MIAFEIFVNGEKRFTAGGEEYQAINGLLSLIRLPLPKPDDLTLTFATSAITPGADRVALWPILGLAVGDRVEIRIVDVQSVDGPESIQTPESGDENVDA